MLITKSFIKDMLKNAMPHIKLKEFQDFYFDDKTYQQDTRYFYVGVLNINTVATITNLKDADLVLSGTTNPVVFKHIVGANYTFMGFKVEGDL